LKERCLQSMFRFHKMSFALVLLIFSRLASPTNSPSLAQPTDGTPDRRGGSQTDRPRLKLPLTSPKIVVKKSARRLLLYSGNKLVRTYRVGLGPNPVGDKVREGDRRTPEGDFYIFTRNSKSAFYLSLGLSYPNAAHAKRGLRDGLITSAQYDEIMRALQAKRRPPQNTALGGDIYIHGNGARSDWTWGCVALENEDIRELFDVVKVGMTVTIEP
jgi:murein L,D-transpeptidase YafK